MQFVELFFTFLLFTKWILIDILGSLLQLESLRSIDLSKNPALLQDPDVTKTFKTNLPWTSVRLSGTVTRLRISNQKFINAINFAVRNSQTKFQNIWHSFISWSVMNPTFTWAMPKKIKNGASHNQKSEFIVTILGAG